MMGDGIHLLVDGLARQPVPKRMVQSFLKNAPASIGMTPIMPLSLLRGKFGWAGVQVIAESHIAIHTKDEQVHCDIFSCKPFEVETAIALVVESFDLIEFRSQSIHRTWRGETTPAD